MMYEQRVLNLHYGDKERHRVTYCCQRCDLNSSCSSNSNSNCGLSSVLVLAERATAIDQPECVSMWNLMPGAKSRREATGEQRRGASQKRSKCRPESRPCAAILWCVQCDVPSRGVSHLFCVAHLSEINHVLVPTDIYIWSGFGYGLDGLRRGLGHATFLALLIN